jgi:hypothetical protein
MAEKVETTAEGTIAQKPTIAQTIGAAILGMIAVKLATFLVTTFWRLVTREDPPQIDMDVPAGKKAAWVAIIGAATGAARQVARDKVKPPMKGPA